jgi:hypothetical protein
VYLDNGDKEYLYLKDKGFFKNIRKLERISIPKGSITIWYVYDDKDGIRITDNFCIIITSNQNEKVEHIKPFLGDTCHLLSLLVNILGLKAYEIIVPIYTCKINPEKNEEFHKFIIDVLKGAEIFNKYIEKNDDYAGDENYIDMPEKEVNKICPGKRFPETRFTRYFYTKKSVIIGAMVLVRAHSHHDLHSEGVKYDDYINFDKFLAAMRYTSKYE